MASRFNASVYKSFNREEQSRDFSDFASASSIIATKAYVLLSAIPRSA